MSRNGAKMMPSSVLFMRGLEHYIRDIRACSSAEEEQKRIDKEFANIRSKFKNGNVDGYNKKKYVLKLLYTYVLGHEVDFGHMEAVNLLSMKKFTEKLAGYLTLGLMLNENDDLVRLIIQTVRNDMVSHNEVHQCLALTTVANIGGREMSEALAADVQQLLVSSASPNFVKKKAALTLLRLYRKNPDIMAASEWSDRIVNLLDDHDLGVVTAVLSLLIGLVSKDAPGYQAVVRKACWLLTKFVVNREYPVEYVYKGIPSPWIQVKLLKLLQYYPAPEDSNLHRRLMEVLRRIINVADLNKSPNHNNALYSILFEAINLVVHLDCDRELVVQSAQLLGRFISAKETNIRYLGLEAMAKLATIPGSIDLLKKHQGVIINSLKDNDISIRRRALDLLYEMCDRSNCKSIVGELLRYLQTADINIREELVLRIAILAEQFATTYNWYLDVVLQLIGLAGDAVSDDIWYRAVQVVTNNEDLQEYAAKTVLDTLRPAGVHESGVRVGAYILGEFGPFVSDQADCSQQVMFDVLYSKYHTVSTPTKAILLSTFIKFVNLWPELKEQILPIFQREATFLDPDVQQRACEYLVLADASRVDLLATVWDMMPEFPDRESGVLKKIRERREDTADRTAWRSKDAGSASSPTKQAAEDAAAADEAPSAPPAAVEHVKQDLPPPAQAAPMLDLLGDDIPTSAPAAAAPTATETGAAAAAAGAQSNGDGLLDDLRDLGIGSPGGAAETGADAGMHAPLAPSATAEVVPPSAIAEWYNKLVVSPSGVLYEDSRIQIGVKSEYNGRLGTVQLFYGNKLSEGITGLRANIPPRPYLSVQADMIAPTLASRTQAQQVVRVECQQEFTESPELHVAFACSSGQQMLRLRLPLLPVKFTVPAPMTAADFFPRWKAINGMPLEDQQLFRAKRTIDLAMIRKFVMTGLNMAVLDGVDPTPSNFVLAGTFSSKMAQHGVMVRLESNEQAQMFRLTVRCTAPQLTSSLKTVIVTHLGATS